MTKMMRGKIAEIGRIGPRRLVGELAFFGRCGRSATVEATQDTELVELNLERFRDYLDGQPPWLRVTLDSLVEHLREAGVRLSQLASSDPEPMTTRMNTTSSSRNPDVFSSLPDEAPVSEPSVFSVDEPYPFAFQESGRRPSFRPESNRPATMPAVGPDVVNAAGKNGVTSRKKPKQESVPPPPIAETIRPPAPVPRPVTSPGPRDAERAAPVQLADTGVRPRPIYVNEHGEEVTPELDEAEVIAK